MCRSRRGLRISTIILIITILVDIYMGFTLIYSSLNKSDWCYVECEKDLNLIQYNSTKLTYTKEELKRKLEDLLNPWGFIYIEKDFNSEALAYTIITFRTIIIKTTLNNYDYAWAYTHELIHLTEMVGNERYTNYRTFVVLYESGDEQLRALAMRYAYEDMLGKADTEYSCWYYIKQYLLETGV